MGKKKWVRLLCNVDLFIAAIALIVLIFVTCASVVMRYIIRNPFLWTEEVQAFCQVWMVFLGGSVAFRMGSIVCIEMVVDALPEKARKIMGYVIDAFVLFVLVYLATHISAYVAQTFGRSGRTTSFLKIPYTLIYGVAPWSCILMILSYLANRYLPGFCKDINIEAEVAEQELIVPGSDADLTAKEGKSV